jgi:hypothetical protein
MEKGRGVREMRLLNNNHGYHFRRVETRLRASQNPLKRVGEKRRQKAIAIPIHRDLPFSGRAIYPLPSFQMFDIRYSSFVL